MLLPHIVNAYEISSFIQIYEKAWATRHRLTTLSSQVYSESDQYRKDFAIFLSYNYAKPDIFLTSLMERFPNEVDNILTQDASTFQEIKTKFLNLHLAGCNGDLAHYTFRNKKTKSQKWEPNPLVKALLNPVPHPALRMLSGPQRQRLALGILNTNLQKPTHKVDMSAPTLRRLISGS
jgi:hypothetical protein